MCPARVTDTDDRVSMLEGRRDGRSVLSAIVAEEETTQAAMVLPHHYGEDFAAWRFGRCFKRPDYATHTGRAGRVWNVESRKGSDQSKALGTLFAHGVVDLFAHHGENGGADDGQEEGVVASGVKDNSSSRRWLKQIKKFRSKEEPMLFGPWLVGGAKLPRNFRFRLVTIRFI